MPIYGTESCMHVMAFLAWESPWPLVFWFLHPAGVRVGVLQAPWDFPSPWLEVIPAVLCSPACITVQVSNMAFPCWPSKWELSWLIDGPGKCSGCNGAVWHLLWCLTTWCLKEEKGVSQWQGMLVVCAMPCCELEIHPGVKNWFRLQNGLNGFQQFLTWVEMIVGH